MEETSLRRVVGNLAENAVRYSGAGSRVDVWVRQGRDQGPNEPRHAALLSGSDPSGDGVDDTGAGTQFRVRLLAAAQGCAAD
jgi:signal transduction histidine kinase